MNLERSRYDLGCGGPIDQEFSFLGNEHENVYGQVGLVVHQGNSEITWGTIEHNFK